MVSDEVMGAVNQSKTRNLLQGNCLHLAAWHGYAEVDANHVLDPSEIHFRFYLSRNSYMSLIFNRTKDGYSGVRFSTATAFPDLYFQADAVGHFSSKHPLALGLRPERWHTAVLRERTGKVELTIDGGAPVELEEGFLHGQVIGFRGCRVDCLVDDIRILGRDGRIILTENFANDRNFGHAYIWIFLVIFPFFFLLAILPSGYRQDRRAWPQKILSLQCSLSVAVLLIFAFDFFFWSGRYLYVGFMPRGLVREGNTTRLETLRTRLADRLERLDPSTPPLPITRSFLDIPKSSPVYWNEVQVVIGSAAAVTVAIDKPGGLAEAGRQSRDPNTRVLVLLGTSQTWGEGALHASDRWFLLVHRELSAACARRGKRLITVNLAEKGASSKEMLERYRVLRSVLPPHVVLVNLSVNDSSVSDFEMNLRSLAEDNARDGILTLFSGEPSAREGGVSLCEEKREAMRKVARLYGIPYADLDGYLASPKIYDSGFIWWDIVHQTSYGQALMAGHLTRDLEPLIEKSLSRRPGF